MRLCQDLVTAITPNAANIQKNDDLALVTRLAADLVSCAQWPDRFMIPGGAGAKLVGYKKELAVGKVLGTAMLFGDSCLTCVPFHSLQALAKALQASHKA